MYRDDISQDWENNPNYKKYLERIRRLRLLDDDFMSKCFEDNIECTQLVLSIILENDELRVQTVHAQHSIKNLQGRSVRLDVLATDSSGKQYNIEIQRTDRGAGARRARYNSSLIDANILEIGSDVDQLNETYVIFITENDVIGDNKPIYHINRTIEETGRTFNDGSHIIYVNAAYKDDRTPLGRLMHDFACTDPNDMEYRVLAERTRYFKEHKEGVSNMCRIMEELRDEAIQETLIQTKRSIVLSMLKGGKLPFNEIAEYSGLTIEEVEALAKEI